MTCTGTEMTKIPFITISLCVSPSYFSLYVPDLHHPVIARVFIQFFFYILIIKMVFLEFCQPLQLPFPFHTAGQCLFFLDVTALYSPFHSRTVPVPPHPLTMHVLCNIRAKYQQQKGLPSHRHSEANVVAASGRITAICITVCNYGENPAVFLFSPGETKSITGSLCSCSCFV